MRNSSYLNCDNGERPLVLKQRRTQGCAHFPEFLQNFSERQILWSLCLVVFLALTLKLSIQTSLSVAPKLPVSFKFT